MATAAVPVGFHYETKYVVVSYLGLLSQERPQEPPSTQGARQPVTTPLDKEAVEKLKAEIKAELKNLQEEISEAFTSTGFDCNTSPVFSPADPESSIEDCLAHLGNKALQEHTTNLHNALQNLLSKSLDYEDYKKKVQDIAAHISGWNKVLVPLILLQLLLKELIKQGQQPLKTLLQFGVRYIEDAAADDIIQQGGWGTIFSLESEEEEDQGIIAEDSNDIYILTSDNSGQLSPPESLAVTTSWQSESLPVSLSASQSWHTESLPVSLGPDSWHQVVMDPEDVKSVDSNGGGEERSENNSSNSDIVHVEKEEIAEATLEEVAGEVEATEEQVQATIATSGELGVTALPLLETQTVTEVLRGEEPSPIPSLEPKIVQEEPVKKLPTQQEGFTKKVESETPKLSTSLKPAHTVEQKGKKEGDIVPGPPEIILTEAGEKTWNEAEKPPSDMPAAVKDITSTGDEKPIVSPENKSILFYGGAAAIAVLAVAVGIALALRRK